MICVRCPLTIVALASGGKFAFLNLRDVRPSKRQTLDNLAFLDDNEERSFKRELELFENDIQDEWELDDNEYLSKEELEEADDREKKTLKNGDKEVSNEDDKRWLDIDTPKNGMRFVIFIAPVSSHMQRMPISFHRSCASAQIY